MLEKILRKMFSKKTRDINSSPWLHAKAISQKLTHFGKSLLGNMIVSVCNKNHLQIVDKQTDCLPEDREKTKYVKEWNK